MKAARYLIQVSVTDCRRKGEYRDSYIDNLCKDLLNRGQIEPITVIEHLDHFEILDGNRRVEAFVKLRWLKIIAKVVQSGQVLTLKEARSREHDLGLS